MCFGGEDRHVLRRFVGLRAKFGKKARILTQWMDMHFIRCMWTGGEQSTSYMRSKLSCSCTCDCDSVDGGVSDGEISGGMEYTQRNPARASAVFSPAGIAATAHVGAAPRATANSGAAAHMLHGAGHSRTGGGQCRLSRYVVHVAISLESPWGDDRGSYLRLLRSLTFKHCMTMGVIGEEGDILLSQRKGTD